MSTSSVVAATEQPTPQQLLFARAVILTFQLWPAMRLAVSEEWGGPDSAEKRDFLISHICNEHGQAGASFEPDLDDLAEVLEGYIVDEFECRLEDGSPDWVAGRIVGLHRAVFGPDQAKAESAVHELQIAADQLRGQKANVERGPEQQEDSHSEEDDESMDEDEADMTAARHLTHSQGGVTSADILGASVGREQSQRRQDEQAARQPIVDDDGFEMVVSRRRKK